MNARVRELFEIFAASLAQVFESMAETRPIADCEDSGPPPNGDDILWWEQPLRAAPEMKIWVGASRSAWEYAGAVTLKAAGLESAEETESRNTWLEILSQALSALARAIGGRLGREVVCEGGAESTPEIAVEDWIGVRLTFGDTPLAPLWVAFSTPLMEAVAAAPASGRSADRSGGSGTEEGDGTLAVRSRTMNLLLDVDLPVSISFGKTQLAMRDVIKLTTGSIVELHRGVNEPVDVLVNGSLVARGEVVVVEGNYGVRILEIASRPDRIRSLR